MDPRHPESAIWRMDQLAEQFKFVLDKINHASTSSKLGEAEREGALVVQEICLVAPRLHEAMMQSSRQRRHDLSRGVVEKPVEKSVEAAAAKEYLEKSVMNSEIKLNMTDAEKKELKEKIEKEVPEIKEVVPKKKTTRKKKTAKKAKK